MHHARFRLNAVLVLAVALGALAGGPAPTMAVATSSGCGICWSNEECPSQAQMDFHCQTQCDPGTEAGSCISGWLFNQLYDCPSEADQSGWECLDAN